MSETYETATQAIVDGVLSHYADNLCSTHFIDPACSPDCPAYDKDNACINEQDKFKRNKAVEAAIRFFASKTVLVKYHTHGLMLNGKFVYSPKSGRWRKVRGGPWYSSKSPKDFYKRFMKG